MPSTIKCTYFIRLTEEDVKELRLGKPVEKMAIHDELDNGNVDETWVSIRLESGAFNLERCVLNRYHQGECSLTLPEGETEPPKPSKRCFYCTLGTT